jgi:hypothetical protein
MLLGTGLPGASANVAFTDVSANSASYNAIQWAHATGLVTGNGGRFVPGGNMSRAQFALVMYRYEGRPSLGIRGMFSDVQAGHPACSAVAWAHTNGIVTGDRGRFMPDNNMTKAQMILMLYRYGRDKGYDTSSSRNALDRFSDRSSVPDVAIGAMRWAVTHGLVSGTAGRLTPNVYATREEVVVILHKFVNAFVGRTPTTFEPYNPLTGTGDVQNGDLSGNRPIAISVSNERGALPMNGISKADIVYEVLVEGGVTRMFALYQDMTGVGRVGSIRSARPYTVQLARSYDAVFMTVGGSPQAYEQVADLGVTHIDETSGRHGSLYSRERDRIPGRIVDSYHSVVTTGGRVTRWLPGSGLRLKHDEEFSNGLSFTDDGTPAGGSTANSVSIRFSGSKTSSFSYSQTQNTYSMRQFSEPFIDVNDYSQPTFTNLLILKTSVTMPPHWGSYRLEIITTGSGTGYFVCGGRYVEINWSRANRRSPFVYELKDGTPIDLGRGKTYIAIIPNTLDAVFG